MFYKAITFFCYSVGATQTYKGLTMFKRGLIVLVVLVALLAVGALSTGAQEEAECPVSDFIDVSTYLQNQNYPAPSLNVFCNEEDLIIQSNGIPNFEFIQLTPNDLSVQDYNWFIPLNPVVAQTPSEIPLLGPVAIAVNGLPIYGPNEGGNFDFGDPYLDQILDFCNGHTAQNGDYHFHAPPECLFDNFEQPGLVIAYSFDGYPIVSPFVCANADCTETVELQSSWVRTTDVRNAWEAHEYVEGAGDLDQCNGMVGEDGQYRYYATRSFPYFLGCYTGVASPPNFLLGGGNGQPPQGEGGGPPQGGEGGQPPQGGEGQRPPQGQPPQGDPPPPPGGN